MSNVAIWNRQVPAVTEKRIARELARQTGRMQHITEVTKAGMEEISENFCYGEFLVARGLAARQQFSQPLEQGRLTLAQAAEYHRLTTRYLASMNQLAESAGGKIIRMVDEAPSEASKGSVLERFADWLKA